MKRYRFYAHFETGDLQEEVFEFPDDTPEDVIEEEAREYAFNQLDWGFHEVGS